MRLLLRIALFADFIARNRNAIEYVVIKSEDGDIRDFSGPKFVGIDEIMITEYIKFKFTNGAVTTIENNDKNLIVNVYDFVFDRHDDSIAVSDVNKVLDFLRVLVALPKQNCRLNATEFDNFFGDIASRISDFRRIEVTRKIAKERVKIDRSGDNRPIEQVYSEAKCYISEIKFLRITLANGLVLLLARSEDKKFDGENMEGALNKLAILKQQLPLSLILLD